MRYNYLFGPVISRRLGISLGVDLVPFKTCTLDCVYCECGKTTCLTVDRKEYAPLPNVVYELQDYLQSSPDLDYITFSGSGEPTLSTAIGGVIDYLKHSFPQYRVAVLTNGTLLAEKDVRSQLKRADLVVPSLDAASDQVFERINRPHHGLLCSQVISGLIRFRREYAGEMRLEVFVVPGLNNTMDELDGLRKAISEIGPDRVELNSLDRPGTEDWVKPAGRDELKRIADYLGGVEIVGGVKSRQGAAGIHPDKEQKIISTLSRRPCTAEDIALILNLRVSEVSKLLSALLDQNQVECERQFRGVFYKIKRQPVD